MRVTITLAPTLPPRVQLLDISPILSGSPRFTTATTAILASINGNDRVPSSRVSLSAPPDLQAQIDGSRVYGACTVGDMIGGGPDAGTIRLNCDRGRMDLRLTVDDAGLITFLRLSPAAGEACVP